MKASRIVSCFAVCVVATALLAATSHLPAANTRAAIRKYVEDAAAVVHKSGPSCATFASPEWRGHGYYVFVLGPDDKLVCHPNPAFIGVSQAQIVNGRGQKVGEMIVAKGKGNGAGWVDYYWVPEGKKTEELKSAYVVGVTGSDGKHYTVGAGGFNVKP